MGDSLFQDGLERLIATEVLHQSQLLLQLGARFAHRMLERVARWRQLGGRIVTPYYNRQKVAQPCSKLGKRLGRHLLCKRTQLDHDRIGFVTELNLQ